MSTVIMGPCWSLQMPPSQKAVLISLADQANDDGVCWPAVGTIATRTCLSDRTVRECLAWLEATGAVVRSHRPNASTNYTVQPGKFDPSKAPDKRQRAKKGTAPSAPPAPGAGPANSAGGRQAQEGTAPSAGGGAPSAGPDLRQAQPNRKGTVTEPSVEPPSPAAGKRPPAGEGPSGTDGDGEVETEFQAACRATWTAYKTAYRRRYAVDPVRNKVVNSQIRQLVQRLGRDEAPSVATFYIQINDRFLVRNRHDVGSLLARAETYRTQWATDNPTTDDGEGKFDPVAHVNRTQQGGMNDDGRTVDIDAVRVA